MSIPGQIYDYIVWALNRGYSLATSLVRAVARFGVALTETVNEMGGLAVQAFSAGAAYMQSTEAAPIDPVIVPIVPDRDCWRYIGKVITPDGQTFNFDISAHRPMMYYNVTRDYVLNLFSAFLGGDETRPGMMGDDKFFPPRQGEDFPRTNVVHIDRVERCA